MRDVIVAAIQAAIFYTEAKMEYRTFSSCPENMPEFFL